MIKAERIKEEFVKLVMIDSPSRKEINLARYLTELLKKFNAEITFDKAGEAIGGNCGNMLVRIKGNCNQCLPLMFNAHLDTVKSRNGIKPILVDGVFHSSKDTILGADDKSGITVILEMVRVLHENKLPHGDLELVFTVAEEVGLLGAKNLDYSWISAKNGFALDGGNPNDVVTNAPASNRMKYKIQGLAAHAGVHPEDGISAIQIASHAIAHMPLGRIDKETTANIGTIHGGEATNIIPDWAELTGEARSHNMDKLEQQTNEMSQAFKHAVLEFSRPGIDNLPLLEEKVVLEYPIMKVSSDSLCVKLVQNAENTLNRKFELVHTGGGSDANIFNGQGIETVILGTGMHNPHTSSEIVALDDMVKCAELLVQIASG